MTEAHNEFIKGIASMFNITDEKVIKYEFYTYFKYVNCVKCQKIIKKIFFLQKKRRINYSFKPKTAIKLLRNL